MKAIKKFYEGMKKVASNKCVQAFTVGVCTAAGKFVGDRLFDREPIFSSKNELKFTEIINDCEYEGVMKYRYTFRHPDGMQLQRFSIVYERPLTPEEISDIMKQHSFYEKLSVAMKIPAMKPASLNVY
jgi:hypothetical protein